MGYSNGISREILNTSLTISKQDGIFYPFMTADATNELPLAIFYEIAIADPTFTGKGKKE